ncbi:MAG: hypothetical protein ACTSYD_01750 [Candidatus Heimdallarchaeaceae archaeon]
MEQGVISDLIRQELNYIPKIIKNVLFKWYFWVSLNLSVVILDVIFRSIDAQYAQRSIHLVETIGRESFFALLMIVMIGLGLRFHRQFIIVQAELTDRFRVRQSENIGIFKILFSKKIQTFIWSFAVGLGIYTMLLPFLTGIPQGFPDIPLSYAICIYRGFASIFTNYIETLFAIMIILIGKFIMQFPKKIEKLELQPLYDDRSGGFKSVSTFLLTFSAVVTTLCLVILGITYVIYYKTGGQVEYFATVMTFSSIVPILSFFLLFIFPQINYHKLLKNYKYKKLKFFWDQKNKILRPSITAEDEPKLNAEELDLVEKYNALIREIELISEWPFSYSTAFKLLSYALSPLATIVLTVLFEKLLL